jgi:hypothetical protein
VTSGLILLPLLCAGCAQQRWAEHWDTLPNSWRSSAATAPARTKPRVTVAGLRGYRYNATGGWIEILEPKLAIALAPGEMRRVYWPGEPEALHGFVFRAKSGTRLLLKANRGTLRVAAELELLLLDEDGAVVASLPKLREAFDLDNEDWGRIVSGAADALCAAGEARVLAENEVRLLEHDKVSGRLTDEEYEALVQMVTPLLSQPGDLCH